MSNRSLRNFRVPRSALLLATVLSILLSRAARAQSTAFTYQGQLRQSGALVNVNSDFSFWLYGVASGGAFVAGPFTVLNVPVTNGLFTASVDFGPTPVITADRWLEIATRSPAGSGIYTTLTTRQKLTPAPYSLQTRGIVVDSTGNVGLGTSSPLGKLDLQAGADSTGFGDGKAISLSYRIGGYRHWIRSRHDASTPSGNAIEFFVNNSGTSAGSTAPGTGNVQVMSLLGSGNVGIGTSTPASKLDCVATGVNAVAGTSDTGMGVTGITSAGGGFGVAGVHGESSGGGDGVYGSSSGASGIAIHGDGTSLPLFPSARGVVGESTNNTGVEGDSTSGRGVYGKSISWDGVGGLSASASGVYGKSTSGIGVFGECTTGAAVYGSSVGGYGASGFSVNNHGVFGSSTNFVGVVGTSAAHDGIQGYTHGNSRSGVVGIAASDSVNGTGGYFRNDGSGGQALYADGKAVVKVLQILGADLTESFNVAGDNPQPGDVVVIDAEHPGELKLCASAYDNKVAGIISGAGGIRTGVVMGQPGSIADGKHAVAMTGRVYCRCDATQHPIQVGDLLTTSTTPGQAMKATDRNQSFGAVIGKAMSSLNQEKGLVLVLVNLQ